MKYGNLTLGQVEAIVNKLGGMDVVMSILRGVAEVVVTIIPYITVLVDETKTVEELISEGKYDWSNDNITSKNFPLPEDGKIEKREVRLFHFEKMMTSEEAIAEMDKEGYRPATIWELLGLGRLQREFPVIVLGSVCVVDGRRHVAYLYVLDGRHSLSLRWFDFGWGDYCCFVGVRSSQP